MTDPATDPDDPDAKDLPPGTVLPDPKHFRRNQLWALMVTNLISMIVLFGWWWLQPELRLILICAILVGILLVVNATRWLLARR